MILFFMGALMGSGFASTQGDSQAAIATGHAQRQKPLERRRKIHGCTPIGAQHAQRSLGGQALRPWAF